MLNWIADVRIYNCKLELDRQYTQELGTVVSDRLVLLSLLFVVYVIFWQCPGRILSYLSYWQLSSTIVRHWYTVYTFYLQSPRGSDVHIHNNNNLMHIISRTSRFPRLSVTRPGPALPGASPLSRGSATIYHMPTPQSSWHRRGKGNWQPEEVAPSKHTN